MIAQKDKPLGWIYLYHKAIKILTAYLTLLSQQVNQGGPGMNNYMDLILAVL